MALFAMMKPRRGLLCVGVSILLAAHVFFAPLTARAEEHRFIAFARAVSGDDAGLIRQAQALITTPPVTTEEIGFYGLSKAPAAERSLRGIITLLLNAGYILDFEDKYVNEMPYFLAERGILPAIDSAPELVLPIPQDGDNPEGFATQMRSLFPAHIAAIQSGAEAQGLRLLGLDLGPRGDALMIWPARPELAEKWLDIALYVGPNTLRYGKNDPYLQIIAVTGVDWQRYWAFLTYAYMLPREYWPYPAAK